MTAPAKDPGPKYPDHLPCGKNDPVPETQPFEFFDVASRADPKLPVFNQPGVVLEKITPLMGTKITGLQLAELDSAGLDQLGLLVAQRGFLIFGSRDGHQQNFADVGIPRQLDVGRHFGPLHRHPTLAHPESSDELCCVYADPTSNFAKSLYVGRNTRCVWHHDQAHEHQPPGVTIFACLETPPQGGDTVFANCEEAYRRLSGPMQDFIKDLRMVHTSGHHNMQSSGLGMAKRQELVESAHPLVRRHPITGNPALFVGKYSVSHIEGLAEEESELMMKFLYDMIDGAHDLQARVKWQPGDACVWDQRVVIHTATVDIEPEYRRHFIRITPLGGIPEIYGKDRPDAKGRGGTK